MDFFKKASLSLCVGLLALVGYAQTRFVFDDTKAIQLKNVLLNGHYLETQPALLVQKNSEPVEVMH